jgi:hypothetical protein
MAKITKKKLSGAAAKQLQTRPFGNLMVFVKENGPSFVEWSQKQKGIKVKDPELRTNIANIKRATLKATNK